MVISRQFEKDFTTILIGVLPSILARKGIAGREKVAKAFQDYFRLKGHEWGSALIKNRYGLNAEKGLSVEDNARFEIGGGIAMLVNTAPPIFWMLVLVYSNPELLDDIRKEVASIMNTSLDESGEVVRNLDISNVKSSCPLLASTYQEILRFRSMGASVRLVMEDTLLDGRWLLKKDNLIQMPSRVIHADGSIWGSDVAEFNPRRFLKEEKPKTQNGKRPSPIAFRAFGGGATLCPGRHFATNEILTIVTMFVMRFDMRPVTGDWFLPTTHNTNIVSTMMEPDKDIEVEITLRKGFEEGSWDFGLLHSEKTFALTAEDNAS
jgi:cytochrome P450